MPSYLDYGRGQPCSNIFEQPFIVGNLFVHSPQRAAIEVIPIDAQLGVRDPALTTAPIGVPSPAGHMGRLLFGLESMNPGLQSLRGWDVVSSHESMHSVQIGSP